MKNITVSVLIAFLVLLTSCEKEPYLNIGFDSRIDKNSSGMIIQAIDGYIDEISLNGYIRLWEGEVEINLIGADGFSVYSKTLRAPVEMQIDEKFAADRGFWKLKYKSNDGVGEINLHLRKKHNN